MSKIVRNAAGRGLAAAINEQGLARAAVDETGTIVTLTPADGIGEPVTITFREGEVAVDDTLTTTVNRDSVAAYSAAAWHLMEV